MSRHKIGTSRFGSVVVGDEVRVPLNLAGFRRECNRLSIGATTGVTMTVGFFGFPAMLVYIWIMDPAERSPAGNITGGVLSLVLLLTIIAATWSAMQTAKLLKKTLRKGLPALIINRDGITDYSSNSVFSLIPWRRIQTVFWTIRHSNRQNRDYPGLVFVVRDKPLLRRRLGLTGYRLEDYPPSPDRREVFVPQDRIAMPVEKVVDQINKFRAKMNV